MLNGNGFYIWQIGACPIDKTIEFLKRSKAQWVSIKVADGLSKMNQVNSSGKLVGNDQYLLEYIDRLRDNGFSVGGWHFVYTKARATAGGQAGLAGERVQKLKLDHWLIDAEGDGNGGWKSDPNRGTDAKVYMNQLQTAGVAKSVPIALSSYRFPSSHGEFPWTTFVNHDRMGFIAQQMYWMGSHNPREQLVRSISEYNQIRARGSKPMLPFVPIGSAWGQKVKIGNNLIDWEPTIGDIKEFVAACKEFGLSGYGWWSLDWIIGHNRVEWLDAMVGDVVVVNPPTPPTPDPEPEPEPTDEFPKIVTTTAGKLNVRNTPIVANGNLVGSVPTGTKFEAVGESPDNKWYAVKVWISKQYSK